MLVNENIKHFKRGRSSKESLGVGFSRKIYPPINWGNMPTSMYLLKDEDNQYNIMFWNQEKRLGKLSDGVISQQRAMSLELLYEVDQDNFLDFEEVLDWVKMIETPQHLIEQGYPE